MMTNDIRAGDCIAFSGNKLPSILINLLCYGIPWLHSSHVGIIAEHEGELLLFESTTLSNLPCIIQGKPVKGVQAVRLADRVKSYDGSIRHYPLYRPLFDAENKRLTKYLVSHLGKSYDAIGAIRSGGKLFSWIESKLRAEDMSRIFCSELVAGAHRNIGLLRTDNVSRWNPNRLIRHERREHLLKKPVRLK